MPGQYDILAPQGATFDEIFTYKVGGTPVDLNGYTARMQVRRTPSSDIVILSLVSPAGITLGGNTGQISVNVSATTMAQIKAGKYRYDLELVSSNGTVTRLLEGVFLVTAEVTR
jgi:hypothetical protein